MNERIEELKTQCIVREQRGTKAFDSYMVDRFDTEKFAELIIGHATECVRDVLRDENSDLTYTAASQVQKRIKEYFGVEK
tara:strand:- start:274 stop:513 length:240 start_codon:yes stop_codon:yes gene_type:complete